MMNIFSCACWLSVRLSLALCPGRSLAIFNQVFVKFDELLVFWLLNPLLDDLQVSFFSDGSFSGAEAFLLDVHTTYFLLFLLESNLL